MSCDNGIQGSPPSLNNETIVSYGIKVDTEYTFLSVYDTHVASIAFGRPYFFDRSLATPSKPPPIPLLILLLPNGLNVPDSPIKSTDTYSPGANLGPEHPTS